MLLIHKRLVLNQTFIIMKLQINIKSFIVEIICLLYIMLFFYAAVNKLLDFENFQIQIGQSPLLSAFASWISWLIPLAEFLIASLLMIPKFRIIGLVCALILMTMFTTYIFIIVHYSSFVPCSCGGILEKMSWNAHFIFNIVFVVLALSAIVLQYKVDQAHLTKFSILRIISFSLILSIAVVVMLFLLSERIIHQQNPFIRRYPKHPVVMTHSIDLKFNSYYFAGFENGKIFLGNYTNPLYLTAMDSTLKTKEFIKISFDPKKIPFKMVTIKVKGKYLYLIDGIVPKIFKGKTKDWKITEELKGIPYFTLAQNIDSVSIVFRSNNGKNSANILGTFTENQTPKIKYNNSLLQQQIDGIFDTDGTLLYSEKLEKIIYLYYYRNEFIVANKNGFLDYRGHTIDTITKAKVKVAYLKNNKGRKMSAPPLIVNSSAAVFGKLLFVNSRIQGRFENEKLWKEASVIDVYNLQKNTYLFSFPIYEIGNKKLLSFCVSPTHLYALIGNELVVHELKYVVRKEM